MIEQIGDLWTLPCNARCVTTNGVVTAGPRLIMGAGVAKEAALRYPKLPSFLGCKVGRYGNMCFVYQPENDDPHLISFPTKHHWRNKSDLALIASGAVQLKTIADGNPKWKVIALPRPGCGLGGLCWDDVKRTIQSLLDDRFVVLHQLPEQGVKHGK